MVVMDIQKIRSQFPVFRHHKDLVYLDNAATTQKPAEVIDAITSFYTTSNATVHRALYPLGEHATSTFEEARNNIASFINAQNREEIIFTKGTTEAINCFARSWGHKHLKEGDEILLTQAEHHANLLPWQETARLTGAKLVFIPVDQTTYGLVNPTSYIGHKTRLVAVTAESNVLGPLWDNKTHELANFIAKAHAHDAVVLIDAAQAIAHTAIDVQHLDADALVFSGHKMFGPTGIGVLYVKEALQNVMDPYQFGGSMIYEAQFTSATWTTGALKFEAGTPPIAQAIGLGQAVTFMRNSLPFDELTLHEARLCAQFMQGLKKIPGVRIIASQLAITQGTHVVSFAVDGLHPHDIAFELGRKNIAVRAGHHCAQPLVTHLGYNALLRVGVAAYNTQSDIDQCLEALANVVTTFRKALYA